MATAASPSLRCPAAICSVFDVTGKLKNDTKREHGLNGSSFEMTGLNRATATAISSEQYNGDQRLKGATIASSEVLILGGNDAMGQPAMMCHVFDERTQRLTELSSSSKPVNPRVRLRTGHTAVAIDVAADRRASIVVYGGWRRFTGNLSSALMHLPGGGLPLADIWMYYCRQRSWVELSCKAAGQTAVNSLELSRFDHAASKVKVPDTEKEMMFVFGGTTSVITELAVEIEQNKEKSWIDNNRSTSSLGSVTISSYSSYSSGDSLAIQPDASTPVNRPTGDEEVKLDTEEKNPKKTVTQYNGRLQLTQPHVLLLDVGQQLWHRCRNAGAHPAPRSSHTATALAAGREVHIFGGRAERGIVLGDHWVGRISSSENGYICSWTQVFGEGSRPPGTYGHMAGTISLGDVECLLIGGGNRFVPVDQGGSGGDERGSLHISALRYFNALTGVWRVIALPSGCSPSILFPPMSRHHGMLVPLCNRSSHQCAADAAGKDACNPGSASATSLFKVLVIGGLPTATNGKEGESGRDLEENVQPALKHIVLPPTITLPIYESSACTDRTIYLTKGLRIASAGRTDGGTHIDPTSCFTPFANPSRPITGIQLLKSVARLSQPVKRSIEDADRIGANEHSTKNSKEKRSKKLSKEAQSKMVERLTKVRAEPKLKLKIKSPPRPKSQKLGKTEQKKSAERLSGCLTHCSILLEYLSLTCPVPQDMGKYLRCQIEPTNDKGSDESDSCDDDHDPADSELFVRAWVGGRIVHNSGPLSYYFDHDSKKNPLFKVKFENHPVDADGDYHIPSVNSKGHDFIQIIGSPTTHQNITKAAKRPLNPFSNPKVSSPTSSRSSSVTSSRPITPRCSRDFSRGRRCYDSSRLKQQTQGTIRFQFRVDDNIIKLNNGGKLKLELVRRWTGDQCVEREVIIGTSSTSLSDIMPHLGVGQAPFLFEANLANNSSESSQAASPRVMSSKITAQSSNKRNSIRGIAAVENQQVSSSDENESNVQTSDCCASPETKSPKNLSTDVPDVPEKRNAEFLSPSLPPRLIFSCQLYLSTQNIIQERRAAWLEARMGGPYPPPPRQYVSEQDGSVRRMDGSLNQGTKLTALEQHVSSQRLSSRQLAPGRVGRLKVNSVSFDALNLDHDIGADAVAAILKMTQRQARKKQKRNLRDKQKQPDQIISPATPEIRLHASGTSVLRTAGDNEGALLNQTESGGDNREWVPCVSSTTESSDSSFVFHVVGGRGAHVMLNISVGSVPLGVAPFPLVNMTTQYVCGQHYHSPGRQAGSECDRMSDNDSAGDDNDNLSPHILHRRRDFGTVMSHTKISHSVPLEMSPRLRQYLRKKLKGKDADHRIPEIVGRVNMETEVLSGTDSYSFSTIQPRKLTSQDIETSVARLYYDRHRSTSPLTSVARTTASRE